MIRYWWMIVLAGWLLTALVARCTTDDVNAVVLIRMFALPQPHLWLGADDLGRAIAPRVIAGAAISLPVALLVVAVSLLVGTAFGVTCAWRGGIWDRLSVHVMDIVLAFPGILLAIALAALLGAGLDNVVIALCTVGWVGFARLARAQTLSLKHRDHVQAARALGVPTVTLLIRHVIQLQLGALLVEAIFAFAGAIAAEAGLSFLGLGAQAPTPSWGNMLREAAQYLLIAPHMLLGPGVAIVSLVLAVQACGEYLRTRWSNE
ncbi:MAG: ABC transporter permease [Gammaproteobacteria bacterium]